MKLEGIRTTLNVWIVEKNMPSWRRRLLAWVEWHIGGKEDRWGADYKG